MFGKMVLIALTAAVLSLLLTRLILSFALRLGLVSRPNPIIRTHMGPAALGGGSALVLVFIACAIFPAQQEMVPARFIWAIVAPFILGLIDDILDLSAVPKVSLELLSVIPYLWLSPLGAWWLVPAALWLVVSQNAWNFIDIMDSLAGWVAVFAFGAASVVFAFVPGGEGLAVFCAACSAAVLGFLFWNSYPARIYMGDSGSLVLGALFGVLVLEAAQLDLSLVLPLGIAGAIPYFEMVFIFAERTRRGIPFYLGSADHFCLRLQHAGWCIPSIIRRVKLVGAGLAALGIGTALLRDSRLALALAGLIFFAALAAAWGYFRKLPVQEDSD